MRRLTQALYVAQLDTLRLLRPSGARGGRRSGRPKLTVHMRMRRDMKTEDQTYIELSRDAVTRRCLQLREAAGCPAGRDLEFWLQAELELISEYQSTHPRLADSIRA